MGARRRRVFAKDTLRQQPRKARALDGLHRTSSFLYAGSKRLGKAEPVIDRRVNVSGGNRIADSEELIRAIGVRTECLLPAIDESRIIDLAAVDRTLLQLEVEIVERRGSIFD